MAQTDEKKEIKETKETNESIEVVDKFTLIGKGTYGEIFTNMKMVKKKSYLITAEILAFFIRIPNIIQISDVEFQEKYITYKYKYHPKIFIYSKIITPQDIANLIKALIRLRTLNMVHLDIKPDNIFYDENNQIHLADLGGLHHLNSEGCVENGYGTYYTVSPENVLSKKFYTNSQVWSIGMTMYHTLVVDYTHIRNFINAFEPPPGKKEPVVGIDLFEKFVLNVKQEAKYNMSRVKNANQSDMEDFIVKCLTVSRYLRPELEELLAHPFLKDCDTKIQHMDYVSSLISSKPINNVIGVVTQIANIYKKSRYPYKVFSIAIHLALTSYLSVSESVWVAIYFSDNNYIEIPTHMEIYAKMRGCCLMPGNSLYYSMKSKEELYDFLKKLDSYPSAYLTLVPVKNFYVPHYIDLSYFLTK